MLRNPRTFLVFTFALLTLGSCVPGIAASTCTTETIQAEAGPICGTVVTSTSGKKAQAFLGIPYAEPFEARWTAPEPADPWSETFEATTFGPTCPQTTTGSYAQPQSENCLYLNVWTPEGTTKGDALPVMAYIYGGSFTSGTGSDPLYNGTYLAANNGVIVVNLNYRLGALGFLATDELRGNYGFLDQQLALRWVQDNIQAFGGDPQKVTLFGESAGAYAVALHLSSAPGSRPLFRAGILESAPLSIPAQTLHQARLFGQFYKTLIGCLDVACLRQKSVEDILKTQLQFSFQVANLFRGPQTLEPWAPLIDGKHLLVRSVPAIHSGKTQKPMLMGTNKDEAVLFYGGLQVDLKRYTEMTTQYFMEHAKEVLAKFPGSATENNALLAASNITAYQYVYATQYIADGAGPPTYVYQFTHPSSFEANISKVCEGYVCHGDELPYVFHTPEAFGATFDSEEETISATIRTYWTNFAKNMDPNQGAPVSTEWPLYDTQRRPYLFLNEPSTPEEDPFAEDTAFWYSIGFNLNTFPPQ